MRSTERYKWVDITDELKATDVHLVDPNLPAVQYRYGSDNITDLLFTLVDTPKGTKKFIPSRRFLNGEFRAMIDYSTDLESGIGAVYQKRPIVEWVDVTNKCKVELCRSGQSHGHYVKVTHGDVVITLLGLKGSIKPYKTPKDYKVEMAENAVVSFKVFKKADC